MSKKNEDIPVCDCTGCKYFERGEKIHWCNKINMGSGYTTAKCVYYETKNKANI